MSKTKEKKWIAPKCPVCGYKQKAANRTAWMKGVYACRCNSLDYDELTRYRKKNPIPDKDCLPLEEGEEIRIVIPGNAGIKKNSQIKTRFGIIPSYRYRVWAARSFKIIKEQWDAINRKTINGPIHLEAHFYRNDLRGTDLSNLMEGVQDCFKTIGVWQDDSLVESPDGSRKHLDERTARTEIILRLYNDSDEEEQELQEISEGDW